MALHPCDGEEAPNTVGRINAMFTYKALAIAAVFALITSLSAPSFAAPFYYNGSPACVEDNGFGPYAGHC
jgi:hypothetical protein